MSKQPIDYFLLSEQGMIETWDRISYPSESACPLLLALRIFCTGLELNISLVFLEADLQNAFKINSACNTSA